MTVTTDPVRPRTRSGRPRRLHALDGLRTIAVLLVLGYHVNLPGTEGGFLGVDIFFVLSGFLITSLLLKEISHRGTADLARFWMRRVLRLLPASLVVILVVLCWAAFVAPPIRRAPIGLDALWCLLYVGNWRFIDTSSYFADDGTTSPLQHVWSLAVEEQFYLLWPLLLTGIGVLAVRRYRLPGSPAGSDALALAVVADSAQRAELTAARRARMARLTLLLAGLLAVVSALALAWTYDPGAPERAYMGTDSKAFEPLIGALAAAVVARGRTQAWVAEHAQKLMVVGLVLVAIGVTVLRSGGLPPIPLADLRQLPGLDLLGGWGRQPSLAGDVLLDPASGVSGPTGPHPLYFYGGAVVFALAVAVLVAATSLADRRHGLTLVLGSTPVAYLGRISYGVYLWHWPLATWIIGDRGFDPMRAGLVAAGTIAAASASYHLVEYPVRTGRLAHARPARLLSQATAIVGLAVLLTAGLGGSPLNRVVPAIASGTAAAKSNAGGPAQASVDADAVLLVGDSVLSRLAPEVARVGAERGLNVVSAARGGCAVLDIVTIDGSGTRHQECRTTVPPLQTRLLSQSRAGTVIWWSRYELADRLAADGRRLVAGTPQFWHAQRASLADTVDRLTATGAQLVIVAVDRIGTGVDSRCQPGNCDPFLDRLRNHDDIRGQWNVMLREYAASDPRVRILTIDDSYCRDDANPCDDALARPDGSHFSPDAMPAVATALLDRIGPARAAAARS